MCNGHNHRPGCTCGFGPPYPLPHPDLILRGFAAAWGVMRVRMGSDWESFEPRLNGLMKQVRRAKGRKARDAAVAELLSVGRGSAAADLFEVLAEHAKSPDAMVAFESRYERAERAEWGELMTMARPEAARPEPPRLERMREELWAMAAPPEMAPPEAAAGAEPHPPVPELRYVNLCFTDGDTPIRASEPLVAGSEYRLRLDIGPLGEESIVSNAGDHPVHTELLPRSEDGHWLKVVASSRQFDVSPVGRWLFLPREGASWTCRCPAGGSHGCDPSSRSSFLMIPARAPETEGSATLRVTLYFQRTVVQSLEVTATIVRGHEGAGANSALVDYNLTQALTDLDDIGPRALSVMMNDDEDSSHTLVFNGAPDEAVPLFVTDGQLTDALRSSRAVLRRVHIEDPGLRNRVAPDNSKPREEFIADLQALASHGWVLWNALWQRQAGTWRENRARFVGESNIIQVARKRGSTTVFPWALVYDIPVEIGAPERNRLCRLLEEEEWRAFCSDPGTTPVRCPFEETHEAGVVCPFGLWGFRYEIEQPPSVEVGRALPRRIPAEPLPLDFMVALSDQLDVALESAHLAQLRRQHGRFTFHECHDRTRIASGLGHPELEVVYFYCHGADRELPGGYGTMPALGVGTGEAIVPTDLSTWLEHWPPEHWQATAPLVFINGCHTANTTPQTLVNFVDTFSAMLHAAGVIGTEITVHQTVANEVAETLLDAFQRGETVGSALRKARTGLLRKGNVLGLVYTAYCSADLRLTASVA